MFFSTVDLYIFMSFYFLSFVKHLITSVVSLRGPVRSWTGQEDLDVEQLLLHTDRSQLTWSEHLVGLPLEMSRARPYREETPGGPIQDTLRGEHLPYGLGAYGDPPGITEGSCYSQGQQDCSFWRNTDLETWLKSELITKVTCNL